MNRREFLRTNAGFAGMMWTGLAINPLTAYSRPTNLRITDIRGCTVAANYDYPIIKIYTNQDIYGLGEVRDAGYLGEALVLKPLLVGKDPLDIEGILETIRPWAGHGRSGGGFSAVDMALFDIAGKALGVPAYKLLGTKLTDKIPVYGDTDANEDKAIYARRAKIRVETWKLKNLKMDLRPVLLRGKAGALENGIPTARGMDYWGEYVETIRAAIGPGITLGADHFGRMTVESGILLGVAMAKPSRNLAYIEDVIPFLSANAVENMKKITDGSPTPTLGYEDIFGFDGFRPFINQNAVDMIHCDMETSGGLLETKRIADYAHRYGIKTMFHHAGSPVGAMASVHCACTLRDFVSIENHAMDIPWWENLVTGIEKPLIRDGCYSVPEKPGLGIELNDEAVRKYLREPRYIYKAGYFEPTPEFDQPMTKEEAVKKRIIARNGSWYNHGGPWVHLNEHGELVNEAGSR
ncbi:MAG: mandelate racemase/muconate lactonizing enzyme family protein [Verrucomicrobia bacterium]|nr:mandelate racemase/muconate lactonizing enzyme family protein [Verrucomicrobiota bacterium]